MADIIPFSDPRANRPKDDKKGRHGATMWVGDRMPPLLASAIAEALSIEGPVTVYGSDKHRQAALADQVASAAIGVAWDSLVAATGIGPHVRNTFKPP